MNPDMRVTIASVVACALKEFTDGADRSVGVRVTETTNGCPLVELTVGTQAYNLTITKARNHEVLGRGERAAD